MFVIAIDSDDTTKYVGKGEYSRFEVFSSFMCARIFETKEEAIAALSDEEFTKRTEYTDKSSSPPPIIHTGLGICHNKPEAEGVIRIVEVQLHNVHSVAIKDKLSPC